MHAGHFALHALVAFVGALDLVLAPVIHIADEFHLPLVVPENEVAKMDAGHAQRLDFLHRRQPESRHLAGRDVAAHHRLRIDLRGNLGEVIPVKLPHRIAVRRPPRGLRDGFAPDQQRDLIFHRGLQRECADARVAVPARVADFEQRLPREFVHERAARRKHDVIDIELIEAVLEVVFPRLGKPGVAEGHGQRAQAIDLGQHMELKGAVLAAADRDDAVVVALGRAVAVEDRAEFLFALHPVDADLVLGGLAGLADVHLVELHSLIGLGHAAAHAVAHFAEKGLAVGR